jgi:putative transposase
MRAAIRQALARAALVLPEGVRPQQMLTLLPRLGQPPQTTWTVPMRERYRPGAGGETYLGRSLQGGPRKNARLVAWDGVRVTCTCRARPEAAEGDRPVPPQSTVAVADFLQRGRLRVPGPQTRVVRS